MKAPKRYWVSFEYVDTGEAVPGDTVVFLTTPEIKRFVGGIKWNRDDEVNHIVVERVA